MSQHKMRHTFLFTYVPQLENKSGLVVRVVFYSIKFLFLITILHSAAYTLLHTVGSKRESVVMSRQTQTMSYLVPEPLEPLTLDEVKFWLRIMQEHAFFIKSGLPCDQNEFIDEAQAFYQEFESLRLRAERVQNEKRFTELVNDTQVLVKEFYVFKRKLLHMMLECKLGGWNFPLLLDHTAREAQYFIRLLDKNKGNKTVANGGNKAEENGFWLRIMADHAKFISHLLDPSEANLIATANAFSEEFDDLFMQGRDFSSMLHDYPEVAAFKRFLQDTRAAAIRLRDFKRAAEEMIVDCRLVGIIPALLADHVRREADHFLGMIIMMEKGIGKNVATTVAEAEVVLPASEVEPKCKVFKVMNLEREQEEEPLVEKKDAECILQEKINAKNNVIIEPEKISPEAKKIVMEKNNVVEESVLVEKIILPDSLGNDGKYKWSGKWPRQLGKKDE